MTSWPTSTPGSAQPRANDRADDDRRRRRRDDPPRVSRRAGVPGRRYTHFGALDLELGGQLPEVTVGYETYGTLNRAGDNAVLVLHALTGDAHAVGEADAGHVTPGWWDAVVGPGRAIDTNRWFVVSSNVLGGCQGTTGPSSLAPDGRAYGSRFPGSPSATRCGSRRCWPTTWVWSASPWSPAAPWAACAPSSGACCIPTGWRRRGCRRARPTPPPTRSGCRPRRSRSSPTTLTGTAATTPSTAPCRWRGWGWRAGWRT